MAAYLAFPSSEKMLDYLRMHPLTEEGSLESITEAMRKAVIPFFAEQSIPIASIKKRVATVIELWQLNKTVQKFVVENFTEALIDCARGVTSWHQNYYPCYAARFIPLV